MAMMGGYGGRFAVASFPLTQGRCGMDHGMASVPRTSDEKTTICLASRSSHQGWFMAVAIPSLCFQVALTMPVKISHFLPAGRKDPARAFVSLENMPILGVQESERELESRQNSATWGIRITSVPFRASIMRGPKTGPSQKGTLPVTARPVFGGIESTMAKATLASQPPPRQAAERRHCIPSASRPLKLRMHWER